MPAIAGSPDTSETPIIVLTALAGEEIDARARDAGADVCLTKPCSIADLEKVIQEQLQLRRDGSTH